MWTQENDISNDVNVNKENDSSAEPHYIMSDDDPADQPTSTQPYSYEQGTTKLGYDPIKEFPDVFSDIKPTELPPLRYINQKINIISDQHYKNISPRKFTPTEVFRDQLEDKIARVLQSDRIYPTTDLSACCHVAT